MRLTMTKPDVDHGNSNNILHDEIVPERAPWMHRVNFGERLRFIDVEGNQAGDFLIYAADDDAERYSAQDTIAAQHNIFLREGAVLLSNEGRPMMTITRTNVAYHDTIGGACSSEGKRDMVSNINFFMNVPVEADGTLGIVYGISAPGLTVDVRAEMDVIVVVSNCPQINNPCNGFNPTPVRMVVTA